MSYRRKYFIFEILEILETTAKAHAIERKYLKEALKEEQDLCAEKEERDYQACMLLNYVLNRCAEARKIAEGYMADELRGDIRKEEKAALESLNRFLDENVEHWMERK